jgi:hypothetical protein
MAQYWIPPSGQPAQIAPSLVNYKRGVGTDTTALPDAGPAPATSGRPYPYPTKGEEGNPTVVPRDLLANFHFAFLIRHPRNSIPSYYRCTIPPLDKVTGFYQFRPDEAGYNELRRLFDYLRAEGLVGPRLAGQDAANGSANGDVKESGIEITLIDADDLLNNPSGIVEAFCKSTGIKYEPEMLKWDTQEHQDYAKKTFEKWKGFHDDAIESKELKQRTHVSDTLPFPFTYLTFSKFPFSVSMNWDVAAAMVDRSSTASINASTKIKRLTPAPRKRPQKPTISSSRSGRRSTAKKAQKSYVIRSGPM